MRRVRTIDASSWSAEQVGAAHVDTGQAFALAHRLDEVVIDLAAPLIPSRPGHALRRPRVPQIPCHIASSGSPNAVTPPRPGRRTDFPTASHRCSIMLWCMYRLRHTRRGWEEDAPTHCPVGHPLGPNQALVGSRNCECGTPHRTHLCMRCERAAYTPALGKLCRMRDLHGR